MKPTRVLTGRCLCEGIEYRIVGSKAPWFEIADGLPQYETWPGSRATVRRTRDES